MQNPLLDTKELPVFSKIRVPDIQPAIDSILAENKELINRLLQESGRHDWQSLMVPMEEADDRLDKAWSPVSHMNSVVNSDELRETYNKCLLNITAYYSERGQSRELYAAYQQVAESGQSLTPTQVKVLDDALRDFRLSGIDLEPEDKDKFRDIKSRLAELQNRFADQVLDATQAWKKHITDVKILKGLPESALAMAAQSAGEEDGYILTLDFPSYQPVMTYCENRTLRKEMYEAFTARASDRGPHAGQFDNGPLMVEILALRSELATLLGYDNYVEFSLATKMADSTQQVLTFLNDLASQSLPVAKKEFRDIQDCATELGGPARLEAWDLDYYSEKLKQQRYNISQEQLRAFFPLPRVLAGLFDIVHQLYDIDIVESQDWDTWHADVRCFEISRKGKAIAAFYLDLHARSHKQGGAWMDSCRVRRLRPDGVLQRPVAYLTCNFSPPIGKQDALLTHNEVVTLFHEFGHGLHHMLTRQDCAAVSGINGVPWDAVELPSQFMENWCWRTEGLKLISGHVETGEPLPEDLLLKLLDARRFKAAVLMLRQLEFALFDCEVHAYPKALNLQGIQSILDQVRTRVSLLKPAEFNRFQHGFTHIFAGGYAAGYYSYKWAEVLAADAFSEFEEHGVFNRQISERFLTGILEQGGSRDPMDLMVEFLGRQPEVKALLQQQGIVTQAGD